MIMVALDVHSYNATHIAVCCTVAGGLHVCAFAVVALCGVQLESPCLFALRGLFPGLWPLSLLASQPQSRAPISIPIFISQRTKVTVTVTKVQIRKHKMRMAHSDPKIKLRVVNCEISKLQAQTLLLACRCGS
jgi:hypothetical protein